MIVTAGGSRFDSLRHYAFLHNMHLDTRSEVRHGDIGDTLKHLDDCINHPTTGLIARKEMQTPAPNYRQYYSNKEKMFKFPEVKLKNDILNTKIKLLYPKTLFLREKLIEAERVVLGNVKPVMGKFRKIMFRIFGI